MTALEIAKAQVARARNFFRQAGNVQILLKGQEQIETSHTCGLGCQLTPKETEALSIFLRGQKASLEVKRLQKEAVQRKRNKVIKFPTQHRTNP